MDSKGNKLEPMDDSAKMSREDQIKSFREKLYKVHNEGEVERAVHSEAEIIGINNRDLNTLSIDINMTRRLRPLIPQERIVISESGIRSKRDIEKLRKWGVDAVLVGEALVTAGDVMAKMKELLR